RSASCSSGCSSRIHRHTNRRFHNLSTSCSSLPGHPDTSRHTNRHCWSSRSTGCSSHTGLHSRNHKGNNMRGSCIPSCPESRMDSSRRLTWCCWIAVAWPEWFVASRHCLIGQMPFRPSRRENTPAVKLQSISCCLRILGKLEQSKELASCQRFMLRRCSMWVTHLGGPSSTCVLKASCQHFRASHGTAPRRLRRRF